MLPAGPGRVLQRKTAILTLTDVTEDMIDTLDTDEVLRRMEADAVVESNAKSLALANPTAEVHDVSFGRETNVRIPADKIRGVKKLFIVAHGSGKRVAGLAPNELARALYAGLYEDIKKSNPMLSQDEHFGLLKQELLLEEIQIVACHSAEGATGKDNFTKEFFQYVSRLPKDWNRTLAVHGVGGTAIVDYSGKIRAIPPEKYKEYKSRKGTITGLNKRLQHTELLDEIAPQGTGIKSYVYDPHSLNF